MQNSPLITQCCTSKYGIAHGHAAALCVRKLWPMMISLIYSHCSDSRGKAYLHDVFCEISDIMGCGSSLQAAWKFEKIFLNLDLDIPNASFEEVQELAADVNPVRLKNNPIEFRKKDFVTLYGHILDPIEAFIDRLVINIADRLEDYFKDRAIHYNKSADSERIIFDYIVNRKSWSSVSPNSVNTSKELEEKINFEGQLDVLVNGRTTSINNTENELEFQLWKKRLRKMLMPQDRLLGITNFDVRNDWHIVLEFKIERECHKESFVTEI